MTTTSTVAPATRVTECPSCGKKGKRGSPVTLRALLKQEYAERIVPAEYTCCDPKGNCKPLDRDTGWRFCDSPDCDVVYFGEHSDTTFTKSQLSVSVGVKESTGERPLCYCFGHSVATITEELRTKGWSDALEDIRRKMKDPGCYCETSNPSGTCCLGSVAKGTETARKELEMAEVPEPMTHANGRFSSRGETISRIGVLVSAVMASACCWLPLVLLAVGISGAGIAATLEARRPIFAVVTFGFLAGAFYFAYRRRDGSAGEHACCAPERTEAAEDCYAPSGKRRFRMMAMNKVMLWVVTVLAMTFLLFPHYVGTLLGSDAGMSVTADMNRSVVKIEGMTCDGCAAVAEKALRGVPGVLAVDVDYQRGEAVIGIEAGDAVPRDEIIAVLKKVGYVGRMDQKHTPK